MENYVIKRNGKYEPFLKYKIENAISSAFNSVSEPVNSFVIENVIVKLETKTSWTVEEIQDLIELTLYEHKHFNPMRSFMQYRHTRKLLRSKETGFTDQTTFIDCTQTIDEYINNSDWRINANANTSFSNAGLVNNAAGKIIANYWLDKVYSKQEGHAHRNGDIHIHDLDCLTGYCAGWSLRSLLNEGFNGVRGRVESRPPSHFREALGQMANFLGILQSEWAGAKLSVHSTLIWLRMFSKTN
jgi:anaerobic ribonucleoside-triphosphate reductase